MRMQKHGFGVLRATQRWAASALLAAGLGTFFGGPTDLYAEEIKLPANKDVWISAANKEEVDYNMGGATTMKLKAWQEYGLIDFDLTQLKGKKIKSAELFIFPVPGKGERTPLHWLVLSTIASPWVEGKSESYAHDDAGKGATFNEASYKTRPWAWPGSKAFDVMLGNGNSLRDDVELSDAGGGWWKAPVRKELVESMVAGASHGLMVMDGSTGVNFNTKVYQRDQNGKGPYLLVQIDAADKQAPAAIGNLRIKPEPNRADVDSGAVTVTLNCPPDVAALTIQADGQDLPRYNIPQPKPGPMTFELVDLPADKEIEFSFTAIDGAGNASPVAKLKAKSSPAITVPKLPAMKWQPKGGTVAPIAGKLRVWAVPELVKTDPKDGKIRFEGAGADYSQKNAVFDGATSTVHLSAARAEIAACQLIVEASAGALENVVIEIGDLKKDDKAAIPAAGLKLWRLWYVDGEAEFCVPLKGGFDVPAKDNKVSGQKTQQIAVDLFVPKTVEPGLYKGAIKVSAGENLTATLPFEIQVYSAVIPDELNFNPELNCYGSPTAGTEVFFDYHRLAHYNRCTLNRVPYSQSGNIDPDVIPKINGSGKVVDWSEFDKNMGPILNGEAFKNNPRAGVPVRTWYLPQYESWPLSWRGHYNPGPNAIVPDSKVKDEKWKDAHDTYAKPVADSFDDTYKKAWIENIQEFVKHFEAKGYTKTACELYLNNKYGDGRKSSLWTLDEPYEALDWQALRFFSILFHEAIKDIKRPGWFVYRGDISRPEWQGNYMDGWMEYMYCNSGAFAMSRLVTATRRRSDMWLYIYGSANDPRRNNYESAAWCYKALFMDGCGVLPWQSLGDATRLTKLDKDASEALLVDGKQFGVSVVASMRVHALRRGAQDAELMLLLQKKHGWSRTHLNALVSQKLALTSEFTQARQDDAAAVTFKELPSERFIEIKDAVLQLLDSK